jgi:hypothetical protein
MAIDGPERLSGSPRRETSSQGVPASIISEGRGFRASVIQVGGVGAIGEITMLSLGRSPAIACVLFWLVFEDATGDTQPSGWLDGQFLLHCALPIGKC